MKTFGKQEFGDFRIVIGERKITQAATKLGAFGSSISGDPTSSLIGRALDLATDAFGIDIEINANDGTISVIEKSSR